MFYIFYPQLCIRNSRMFGSYPIKFEKGSKVLINIP